MKRDPETVKVVNCSQCGAERLGLSESAWVNTLSTHARSNFPPLISANTVNGRPVCQTCEAMLERAAYLERMRTRAERN